MSDISPVVSVYGAGLCHTIIPQSKPYYHSWHRNHLISIYLARSHTVAHSLWFLAYSKIYWIYSSEPDVGWILSTRSASLVQLIRRWNWFYAPIRGLYFGPKTIFIPPPSENDISSPSCDMLFFDSHHGLFALIIPYFAFILPLYFPFYNFFPLSSFFFPLSSFFLYIFPFFLFLYFPLFPFSFIFSIFFSSPFHIFSPKWHRLIFPPPRRGGIPIYRPLAPIVMAPFKFDKEDLTGNIWYTVVCK